MIRHDLFQDKKGIHVKLTKSTHAGIRKELFDRNITMQAVFEEFAILVTRGDRSALKILDNIAKRVLNKEISKYKLTKNLPTDELDHETLYHLIEEYEDDESEEHPTGP